MSQNNIEDVIEEGYRNETYLSDQELKVWVLTHLQERSYANAASKLGVEVETVKTYVSRVSKKKQKARQTLALLD
jgi:DNA-directed RNA polymerase specialized sigma24 family protein